MAYYDDTTDGWDSARDWSGTGSGWRAALEREPDAPPAGETGPRLPSLAQCGAAVQVAGATLSVALVAGLVAWGWQLIDRDVNGVPVVAALEGPMRVAPEEPGGRQAAHQGLAVNRIAAEGKADDGADRLTLAPRPVRLTDEDVPAQATPVRAEPDMAVAETEAPSSDRVPSPARSVMAPVSEAPSAEAPASEMVAAPAAEPEAAPTNVTEAVAPPPAPRGDDKIAAARRLASATDAAVAEALGGISEAPVSTASEALADKPGGDDAARVIPAVATESAVAPGTRLVQLGAYASPDLAAEAWDRATGRFAGALGGKAHVIQQTQDTGRPLWRLRVAGFDSASETQDFCAALAARGADCMPVTQR